jgi:hypothetical protein
MVSLKKLIGALLLVLTGYLTMSCDDFFSPTVEIFNKLENSTTMEQDQGQNQEQKKTESKKVQINQQQF